MVERVYHPKCLRLNYLKDSLTGYENLEFEAAGVKIASPDRAAYEQCVILEENSGASNSIADIEENELPRGAMRHAGISEGKLN
jgi:hypothetical protein